MTTGNKVDRWLVNIVLLQLGVSPDDAYYASQHWRIPLESNYDAGQALAEVYARLFERNYPHIDGLMDTLIDRLVVDFLPEHKDEKAVHLYVRNCAMMCLRLMWLPAFESIPPDDTVIWEKAAD